MKTKQATLDILDPTDDSSDNISDKSSGNIDSRIEKNNEETEEKADDKKENQYRDDYYKQAKDMSKKERIDFIRENGSKQQVDFIESITGNTKYTIKKEIMWKNIEKGIKPVRHILANSRFSDK